MNAIFTPETVGFWHVVGMIALVWAFFLIPVWGRLMLWILRQVFKSLLLPTFLLGEFGRQRQHRQLARNYALLNEYLPRMRDGAQIEYFRALIARGVRTSMLRTQLDRHLEELVSSAHLANELYRLRHDQRRMITQGMVQLEQMHYQDRAISTIAERLQGQDLAQN